nr:MAG TPA: hypothetical protein [Caudoviricetes sp.]
MERLTKWNESSHKHAYYPRCFKEPCYGGGCKIKDCPFEIAVCERLAAYEDTGLTPKEVTALGELFDYALKESKTLTEQLTLLHHIRELAEADKDGRVVVLPCKVGDTVWFKTYKNNARDCIGVQPHEVTRISASIIVPGEIVDIGIPVDQIGVRVFLSETEAVAADAKPPAGNSILEV